MMGYMPGNFMRRRFTAKIDEGYITGAWIIGMKRGDAIGGEVKMGLIAARYQQHISVFWV